jgi:hypothetical protein
MTTKLPQCVLVLARQNLPVSTSAVVTVECVGKVVFTYLVTRNVQEFCSVGTHVQGNVQKTAHHVKKHVHTHVPMVNAAIYAILHADLAPIDANGCVCTRSVQKGAVNYATERDVISHVQRN